MDMTVRQMLGQKLFFGFQGTKLSDEFKSLIREYKIGNVILFLRNVKSAEQLRGLCAEIQELILEVTGYPAFIVIDQEGGLVSRLPADAVNVPCAMALGATNDPENGRKASEITVRQLRGLGVNFNMAPVLDVNTNAANPVIGSRSISDDPHKVADFAEAAVRAYENTGIFCCGKHFPGHGDTSVDSHLGLPRVEKTLEELEQAELIPFRRCIEAGIPAIMSSHILFPNIEKENIPGTMSRTIITDLLKKRLGFKGLVFSDCLEMAAIQKYYGTANGTVAAFKAGIDLAGLSSTISLMRESAEAVYEAATRGEFDMDEIRESVEKILAFKKMMAVQPEPTLCNRDEDRQAVQQMHREAITCCQGTPPVLDENTFFCGCGDYRASLVGNPELLVRSFPEYMAEAFGGAAMVTSKNPEEEEIRGAAEKASGYERIVLGTSNAHLFKGQLALAKALADTGKELTVVALRNPYDIPLLPDCTCKIAAFDYSEPCFQALVDVFRGGEATGVLPVKL
ncbi:MAG: beta-N-acetylhexosaminidase [Oscillospiraceae bacterium]|nr:beta-N-acetylhexosaminidase [Oscillospiraceae bacterium]